MNKFLLASGALMLTTTLAVAQTCDIPVNHISNFQSVKPSAQPDSLRIPSSHTFQTLIQEGEPYSNPLNGVVLSNFDFTGYVPLSGSSTVGHIALNHEGTTIATAGVSILDIYFNANDNLWVLTQTTPVDFSGVQGTGRNCSGGITLWGTSITSEETLPAADINGDGYQDIGWNVEIDPINRSIIDYDGDGNPDKLWKMGRMSHENVVVAADGKTVYEGNDESSGYIWKFVADSAGDLSAGKLYVLKLDDILGVATSGSWRLIPNATPTECNNVRSAASALGATNFSAVEDVEISPIDGMIYFVSKSSGRVYRFADFGETVNDFGIFVGNISQNYEITYEEDGDTLTAYEQWRSGNDNLAFDDLGNLYVLQDGGRNHIWMVTPCHTQSEPDVRLFAVTPAGCEPTGMTFSPDYKYMFLSIMNPDEDNITVQRDAAGEYVVFDRNAAIVIAHNGFLGDTDSTVVTEPENPTSIGTSAAAAKLAIANLYPNPVTAQLNMVVSSPDDRTAYVKVYSMTGTVVMATEANLNKGNTEIRLDAAALAAGVYNVTVTTSTGNLSARFIKQ